MTYDEQTLMQLRDELRERGLSTSGNKDDLVARLELDDAESGESPSQDPEAPPAEAHPRTQPSVDTAVQASPDDEAEGRPRVQYDHRDQVPAQMRSENQDDAITKLGVVSERGVSL